MKGALIISCIIYAVDVCLGASDCYNVRTLFYEELNCKPHHPPDQTCPSHYTNCDYEFPKGGCRFRGLYYAIGEVLEEEYTGSHGRCECVLKTGTLRPSIECSTVSCPALPRSNSGACYLIYNNKNICPIRNECRSFDTNVCKVDGMIYRKGQRFYPRDTCLQCVCNAGFTGRYTTQHCRKLSCAFEIDHADEISQYCAPFYRKMEFCCPSSWICQDGNERIMPGNSTAYGSNRRYKRAIKTQGSPYQQLLCPQSRRRTLERDYSVCRFKYITMPIGYYFDKYHNSIFVRCSCLTPPFLTCVEI